MSYGRLKIYSDAKIITAENVVDEVSRAHALHVQNQADIRALWEYYGFQFSHYGGSVYHIQGVDLNDMGVISNTTDWRTIRLGAFQTMFSTFQKATDQSLPSAFNFIIL